MSSNFIKNKLTNSTILVTGGAGFVGSFIVEKLLKHRPSKIIIIDNLIRGCHYNMKSFIDNPLVEFIEGDIRDYVMLENNIKQSDYIFHLAALRITRCADNPKEAFEVMSQATFNIIDLASKHNIKKIVYSSTASIYGLAQNFPTPETDNPYDNKTLYGGFKTFGEQILRSYKDMYDLDYLALRYFNIYGPRMDTEGKYTEVLVKWLDIIKDGGTPIIHGDGLATMDFVYVEDIAEANILAMLSDCTDEVFNIAYQKETSLKELLQVLLKVNNSNLTPKHTETRAINPVSRRFADISKAKKILNYTPKVSLEEGLINMSKWYLEKRKEQYETAIITDKNTQYND